MIRAAFKGNPNTNDAGRYSLALAKYREALAIWQRNGCIGPKPVAPTKPASLQEAPETQAERKQRETLERRKAKIAAENAQNRLF